MRQELNSLKMPWGDLITPQKMTQLYNDIIADIYNYYAPGINASFFDNDRNSTLSIYNQRS